MILAALECWKNFSASQDFEDLFQLQAHLFDDLLALTDVALGLVAGQALSRTADRKTIVIQQAANLTNNQHILALIITPVAPPLDGFKLWKLLLPVTQNVWFYRTQITDFTYGEIAFAWYLR